MSMALALALAVYILHCTCSKKNMYIGQTKRTVRDRMAGHRAAFQGKKNMPLYRHMQKKGHNMSNIQVTIIEADLDPTQLEEKEAHWIRTLGTTLPHGLNSLWSLEKTTIS